MVLWPLIALRLDRHVPPISLEIWFVLSAVTEFNEWRVRYSRWDKPNPARNTFGFVKNLELRLVGCKMSHFDTKGNKKRTLGPIYFTQFFWPPRHHTICPRLCCSSLFWLWHPLPSPKSLNRLSPACSALVLAKEALLGSLTSTTVSRLGNLTRLLDFFMIPPIWMEQEIHMIYVTSCGITLTYLILLAMNRFGVNTPARIRYGSNHLRVNPI
jgi:hypothetical protein